MHVEKSQKACIFPVVRREILQGQYAACYSRKETIAQLMTENNVENFIYVPAQSKTNKTRLYVNKRIAAAE